MRSLTGTLFSDGGTWIGARPEAGIVWEEDAAEDTEEEDEAAEVAAAEEAAAEEEAAATTEEQEEEEEEEVRACARSRSRSTLSLSWSDEGRLDEDLSEEEGPAVEDSTPFAVSDSPPAHLPPALWVLLPAASVTKGSDSPASARSARATMLLLVDGLLCSS